MAKPSLQLMLHIPASGQRPDAGFSRAYTEALCREIEDVGEELADYQPETLFIDHVDRLGEPEVTRLLRSLRKKPEGASLEITVELRPELISTALLTALRNFHVALYRIDFGSLNVVDFKRLDRGYPYRLYESLFELFTTYEMTNLCPVLGCGMEGQTEASLKDSINRALTLSPEHIAFTPGPGGERLLAFARDFLVEQGYTRVSAFEFALPGKEGKRCALQCADTDFWGFGAGAISCLDGCLWENTHEVAKYLTHSTEPESLLVRTVRLDEESRRQSYLLHRLYGADGIAAEELEGFFGDGLREKVLCLEQDGSVVRQGERLLLSDVGIVNPAHIVEVLEQKL